MSFFQTIYLLSTTLSSTSDSHIIYSAEALRISQQNWFLVWHSLVSNFAVYYIVVITSLSACLKFSSVTCRYCGWNAIRASESFFCVHVTRFKLCFKRTFVWFGEPCQLLCI